MAKRQKHYSVHSIIRFIALVLILIFLNPGIYAQEKPSFFGINAGAAIPFGNFKSTEYKTGSFAITGFTTNLEGAWFFIPRLGVGVSVGLNLNPLDVASLEWAKVVSDPFMSDVSIRSEPYFTATAMVGLYTQFPVYKKFSATGKLLGGLLYGKTPYQLYKPEFFIVGPPYYEITSAQDWKFTLQAGLGIHYDISGCVGLLAEGSILYRDLYFNFTTANGLRTDVHTIALINTTLGVRIKF